MNVTVEFHVNLGDDLSVSVLGKRLPAGDDDDGLPETVVMDEHRVPGLVVQERDEAGAFVVALSVESLLRVAAAVERLRERAEDGRALCLQHGFYRRAPAEFDRDVLGGVHACPKCEEERLAADAVDRLKAGEGK